MLTRKLPFVVLVYGLWFSSLGSPPARSEPEKRGPWYLRTLSYNVHGTYAGHQIPFTWKTRTSRFPWIGRHTASYDLVLLQEFFRDTEDLYRGHLLESSPLETQVLADGPIGRFYDSGLATLANKRKLDVVLDKYLNYERCHGFLLDVWNGSDCLSQKGVLLTAVELDKRTTVHVYNTHLDAAKGSKNRKAREYQLEELASYIARASADQAVILAGDFNTRLYGRPKVDQKKLDEILQTLNLTDACPGGDCKSKETGCPKKKRIDYIFYRSSDRVALEPQAVACAPLRRPVGRKRNLSDHPALSVTFKVNVR